MSNETKQINQNTGINPEQTPNTQEIQARIARAEAVLNKLRIFPSDWVSESGESKQQTEEKLEECIENLKAMLSCVNEEAVLSVNDIQKNTFEKTENIFFTDKNIAVSDYDEAEQKALARRIKNKFYEVNGVYIPVMPSSSQTSVQWEAIPGKTMISGGIKYSDVHFVKDANGLTSMVKPSEKMDFNENTRDKRLPYVDTVLQGSAEIKAYNCIYREFTNAAAECQNYSSEDHDAVKTADDKMSGFSKPEFVKTLIPGSLLDKLADSDDFAERAVEILQTLLYLRQMDSNGSELIPPFDRNYKMTPFIKRKFSELAQLINRQLGLPNNECLKATVENKKAINCEKAPAQGMTIIVGPRGSGKNKLVEHYATISNRPLFRYVCSPDKEERDLTYDIELSDGEVVKVPTRILTAISTPNAILELDEINLLRPSVAKFFNALFDSDRSVFLSDRVIHATEGVVFVGLMNPADYNGVEDLPETIDDRSNTMALGYPPLKEINPSNGQEIFTYDEALILKNHIAPLDEYTDDQFVQLWNRVINGMGTVNVALDTAKILRDLKNIILIAHRTRQTVEACKTRSGDAQMKRDISLRGTIATTMFYSENNLWDAELSQLIGWKAPWTAAQYAVAMTYLPHTETYRKGQQDKQAFEAILSEGLSV
ncbi:MAG: AAA family ATPase [Bacillota bacterium]|jgi:hypothetical protein